jgi:hypothetical protein
VFLLLRNGSEGMVARCHSFLFILLLVCMHTHVLSMHSSVTFAALHSIFLYCCPIMRGPPPGCRAENRTRGRLTAAWRDTVWASPNPVWATPNPVWARPHSSELRRTLTLVSYAEPRWATPYPSEPRCTLWATPHPTDIRRTLLSNAAPYWLFLLNTRCLCLQAFFLLFSISPLIFFFRKWRDKPHFLNTKFHFKSAYIIMLKTLKILFLFSRVSIIFL